jgi:4-amino-4-deoxy-L-arabinose transferase-like glycosyltransferase
MLADAITALCLLCFGHLMSNTIAGGVAGLAWSLYPPAIVMSTWITQEPIFTAILLAGLAIVLATVRSDKPAIGLSLAAGALMGLATLFRATPLLIPVVLAPAWIWKRRYENAVSFVVAMSLFIIPWTIRNSAVLHDRIVVAT